MKSTFGSAVLLGLLVAAWIFVQGFTGWYRHPQLRNLFFLVVVIEVAVLIVSLRATRDQTYGRQVGRGVLIAALGGLLIFSASLVFSTIAFPSDLHRPLPDAIAGYTATVMTGLVASLGIAIFTSARRAA